jgi:hypothetical protein
MTKFLPILGTGNPADRPDTVDTAYITPLLRCLQNTMLIKECLVCLTSRTILDKFGDTDYQADAGSHTGDDDQTRHATISGACIHNDPRFRLYKVDDIFSFSFLTATSGDLCIPVLFSVEGTVPAQVLFLHMNPMCSPCGTLGTASPSPLFMLFLGPAVEHTNNVIHTISAKLLCRRPPCA